MKCTCSINTYVDQHSCCCRHADATKQDVLKQAVLRVVQTVIATLAAAVASTGKQERVISAVLPTLTILLEWWAVNSTVSR